MTEDLDFDVKRSLFFYWRAVCKKKINGKYVAVWRGPRRSDEDQALDDLVSYVADLPSEALRDFANQALTTLNALGKAAE